LYSFAVITAYFASQIRAAEAPHLALGEPLMQRAATGLAAAIRALEPTSLLVLVGSGNNGADALWAAGELAAEGVDVAIVATSDHPNQLALDAALNAGAQLRQAALAVDLYRSVDVVVDGILGIGSNASVALRGTAREIVRALLETGLHRTTVAVDIPSGINPDDGSVPDPAVLPADLTVTFGGYKAGLFLDPAAALAGEVTLVDVGIGADLAAMTPVHPPFRG
jgi:NAD(P)H-hydrate epimerase